MDIEVIKKLKKDYHENGYTIFPNLLNLEQIKSFISQIEQITKDNSLENHDASKMEMEQDQEPEGKLVRRLYEPCTYYENFRNFSESLKILNCIECLLGSNIIYHYSKLNMKPPSIGSKVEWHQDLSYYPLTNRDSIAVLIYLDDATKYNSVIGNFFFSNTSINFLPTLPVAPTIAIFMVLLELLY